MADDADNASEVEQRILDLMLNAKKPVPVHTGFCLNCEEPSDGAYCDSDCRADAERRNRLR